jgi:BirA family biotin operon repressor/biotin-[acetyl-CoA-carboxylase] ligase
MNTLFIGQRIIRLKSIESTNNFAANLPLAEAPEGTVVIADEQTNGRGQFGRIWHSDPGLNLTLTVVLRPNSIPLNQVYQLNKAVAIALAKTLKSLIPVADIKIKWPNDVFANNHKLAGILTENSIRGGQFVSYLAGIGVNVNQVNFPETAANPISMKQLAGTEFNLEDLLFLLCKEIEVIYLKFRSSRFAEISNEFEKWLWKKDEEVLYEFEGNQTMGIIRSVNELGELLIETENQGIKVYQHGSIRIIHTY